MLTLVPLPDRRLVLAVAFVGTAAVVAGQTDGLIRGEPNIDAHLPDNEVSPGSEDALEIQLQHDGTLRTGSDGFESARG
ncbi:hypothetical protein [Natrialbaceae archaeon AArc-T1-2]|uniref:hypothetical protein n=1 Tax=Natrialbaceae archaeon AArc-T1-2 TaxID=3053904 RepID=UPI00255B0FED|nr:hypothetical protein [Natrialbaceae archaeon AArc-T1-2]WIV68267.1 hypothetical protein QQ977_05945 [Natrialbaceae archaeon AArc-T1-2]